MSCPCGGGHVGFCPVAIERQRSTHQLMTESAVPPDIEGSDALRDRVKLLEKALKLAIPKAEDFATIAVLLLDREEVDRRMAPLRKAVRALRWGRLLKQRAPPSDNGGGQ